MFCYGYYSMLFLAGSYVVLSLHVVLTCVWQDLLGYNFVVFSVLVVYFVIVVVGIVEIRPFLVGSFVVLFFLVILGCLWCGLQG